MFAAIGGIGFLSTTLFESGQLDAIPFIRLVVGGFLVQFALSGICFFASCLYNTSRKSLALGAGICIGFYVISLIQKLDTSLSFLKYFTINALYDIVSLVSGTGYVWQIIALSIIGLVGYAVGVIIFKKKDLPL